MVIKSFISDYWYEDKNNFKKIWFKVEDRIEKSCKYEDGSWWFCARLDNCILRKHLEIEPCYKFSYKWVKQKPKIIDVNYIDYARI